MVACIQPNLSSGEAVGSRRIPDTKQLAVCTRRFMTPWSFDAFGSGMQANALALAGQPRSYLRLKAYSFLWLCEGAYGDSGGSVLNDCTQGLTHRLILFLDPEHRKNRLANHRVR
jgi:hypothetical protein